MHKLVFFLTLFLAAVTFTSCDDDYTDEFECCCCEEQYEDDECSDDEEIYDEEIGVENLPQNVTDYITANYPDATIEEAAKLYLEDDDEFIGYAVLLEDGTILIFDENGNFEDEHHEDEYYGDCDEDEEDEEDFEEVALEDLPQTLLDYVAANYPNQTIVEAWVGFDEEGDIEGFAVMLDNDLVLIFDEDGNFVEIHEEEDDEDDAPTSNG